MPWKETCAVDERLLMITEYRRGEASVSELCRRYGVSRKTGHKWIAHIRYFCRMATWCFWRNGAAHGSARRTLQAAQSCPNPIVVRIETKSGHGAGRPTTKLIDEAADRFAFLVKELRMNPTLQ